MKKTVGLAVGAILVCACGVEADNSGRVTPLEAELSSGLPPVQLTLACSQGTCRDPQALEPRRTQQSPSTLGYSTFLGFSGTDYGKAVAVDPAGNAYLTGTLSLSNGTTNVFVAKMSPTGQNLYLSYFPGSAAGGIAADSSGNAYIAARSSNGSIVAKLNPSGSAFVYYDIVPFSPEDITVDSLGNAYVTGLYTQSTTKSYEVAVGKLNPAGSAFTYLVTFGGTNTEFAKSIAIDASGNAYISGQTSSTNFPLVNAFQTSFPGSSSSFVTKLDTTGTSLVYSTYLSGSGSSNQTENRDIAVDGAGNAYVVGTTDAARFPVTPGAAQPLYGGWSDGYVAKLNAAGGLAYATYVGGSSVDRVTGVAVDDSSGVAYVTGYTGGNLPVTSNAFRPTTDGVDAFVIQVSPSGGSFLYASYLGGSSYENVDNALSHNIALDSARNVYVSGDTQSANFPTTVYSYAGGVDAFITKFNGP